MSTIDSDALKLLRWFISNYPGPVEIVQFTECHCETIYRPSKTTSSVSTGHSRSKSFGVKKPAVALVVKLILRRACIFCECWMLDVEGGT